MKLSRRVLARTVVVPVVAGATLFGALPAHAAPTTVTFVFTGAEQTFTVPKNVRRLAVTLVGGSGGTAADAGARTGGQGGAGASIHATVAVTPGQILYLQIGGTGAVPAAGYNGGGAGA
ncbi:MAG TPA: hypothetical protein VJT31_16850, partial [Rugosimonospora sp.]|nr:hypothetical protein [Rugosimonospora sp.]